MFVLESSTLPNSPGIRASACADLRCLRRLRLWRLLGILYRLCFVCFAEIMAICNVMRGLRSAYAADDSFGHGAIVRARWSGRLTRTPRVSEALCWCWGGRKAVRDHVHDCQGRELAGEAGGPAQIHSCIIRRFMQRFSCQGFENCSSPPQIAALDPCLPIPAPRQQSTFGELMVSWIIRWSSWQIRPCFDTILTRMGGKLETGLCNIAA